MISLDHWNADHRGAVACIGRRQITPEQRDSLEMIGAWVLEAGFLLSTGNAPGSDQAFARGANRIDPHRVVLHLPWPRFESDSICKGNRVLVAGECRKYASVAETHHPAWSRLSQGARKLMTRNVSIVDSVVAVIALPNPERAGDGGTGQGMRVARAAGIPVIDLARRLNLELLGKLLGQSAGRLAGLEFQAALAFVN